MATLERIYKLTVDSSEATSKLKRLNGQADQVGGRLQALNDFTKRASKSLAEMATVGAATAATGLAALVTITANSAREIKNLSAVAGTTPQQFQRWSFAAQRVGIEQEKLSDILKDTNDRIGDFIQTGGGPMVDFFENIAPRVGVTAAQFEKLSGPDALQLYVSSLEAANLSQADMTFYLEAMASDATALIPLLRNGGEEMRRLGDQAERTGNVLSADNFSDLEKIRQGIDDISAAATGMKNQIVLAAIPAIDELVDLLSDEQTLKNAQALGGAVISAMNGVVKSISGAIDITRFLAEELAAITGGAAADDIVRLEDELQTLYSMLDNPLNRVRLFGKDGAIAYYDEDEIYTLIAETEEKINNARKRLAEQARNAPPISLTPDPLLPDTGKKSGAGGPTKEQIKAYDELLQKVRELRQELDPTEAALASYRQSFELLNQALAEGAISEAEYSRLLAQLSRDLEKVGEEVPDVKKDLDVLNVALGNSLARGLETASDAFVDFALTGKQSVAEMAQSIISDFSKIILRAQFMKALTGTAVGDLIGLQAANGAVFDSAGNVQPFAKGGIVSQPTVFPFASGIGLMGEAGPEAIMPLARDSSGRLGVSGSATTVNVYNNTAAQATVTEQDTPGGGKTISVMIENAVDKALARGRFDKTMSAVYGQRRRGT